AVTASPPRWEIGIYAAGAVVLLGVAALNLWKLWRSGTYPAPSPFPNYDYRYLEQKDGGTVPAARSHCLRSARSALYQHFPTQGSGSLFMLRDIHYLASLFIIHQHHLPSSAAPRPPINTLWCFPFLLCSADVPGVSLIRKPKTQHLLQAAFSAVKQRARSCSSHRGTLIPWDDGGWWEHPMSPAQIQRGAGAVAFEERFSVPLEPAALEEQSLRFSAFGIDEDERNVSTGVAELKLCDLDLATRPFNAWLYLQDMNRAVDTVGEILLSLSYLPTAERLTVVVVKAKNLVWTNGKVNADPFVKVYLLQDGRKISKKKTAVKRDDTNPVFNEAMIFSVPAIVLQELSLRVTVAECGEDGRADNTGHVLIGPAASGMGTTHWNQMLATLRRPVSMWHPLRRN
ncbi:SYT12 protein, partial [Probosciger aterrimus]|nr:SYT12 protein [Probosciger aterrimus]